MIPPPLHSHPFTLTLHTSNATPPTAKEAFDLITAHRIPGATLAQITQAQTLGGTLRALSVHPAKGQTKRPGRKAYRRIINDLLHLVQCDDGIDLTQFTRTVKQAKRLLEK